MAVIVCVKLSNCTVRFHGMNIGAFNFGDGLQWVVETTAEHDTMNRTRDSNVRKTCVVRSEVPADELLKIQIYIVFR